MSWFESHLNWSWVIAAAIYDGVSIAAFYDHGLLLFEIMAGALWISVVLWVIHQKGRRWAWIFIPFAILFLENKSLIHKEISNENRGN